MRAARVHLLTSAVATNGSEAFGYLNVGLVQLGCSRSPLHLLIRGGAVGYLNVGRVQLGCTRCHLHLLIRGGGSWISNRGTSAAWMPSFPYAFTTTGGVAFAF